MTCIVHVYQISIKVAVIEAVDMSRLFKINTVFRWGFFLYERIVQENYFDMNVQTY